MITDTFVRQFSVNGGYKSLELVIEYPHPPTLRDFLNEGEIGKKLDALGAEGVRLARHTHIQAAREAVFARLFPRIPTRPAPFVPFGLLDSGESDDD